MYFYPAKAPNSAASTDEPPVAGPSRGTNSVARSLTGHVYGYRDPMTSKVVYIGQTIQHLQKRDRQHRYDSQTPFDVSYNSECKYEMFSIAEKTVYFSNDEEEDIQRCVLGGWLNEIEMQNIYEYKTFEDGLNFTRGGQWGDPSLSTAQAAKKRRHLNFRDRYMPMFREYSREFGSCADIPQTYPVLGKLTQSIRSGEMSVPFEFQDELFGPLGFRSDNRRVAGTASNFERFLRASFWWKEHRGDDLSSMPRKAVIPPDVADIGGERVGENLHKYREGMKTGNYKMLYENYASELKALNFTVHTTLSKDDIHRRQALARTNNAFEKMYPLLEYVFEQRGHVNMKQGEANPDLPVHLSTLLSTTNWKTISGYVYALRGKHVVKNLTLRNRLRLTSLNFFATDAELKNHQLIQGLLYYFENEKYSFPQQGYVIPTGEDVPRVLHGIALGSWVANRFRLNRLPPRALTLIQIYQGRGRPEFRRNGIPIRSRPEGGAEWTEHKNQTEAARVLGINATRINTTLKGGYLSKHPETGKYYEFEYVDPTLNPASVRRGRRPPTHSERNKKRVRVVSDETDAALDSL